MNNIEFNLILKPAYASMLRENAEKLQMSPDALIEAIVYKHLDDFNAQVETKKRAKSAANRAYWHEIIANQGVIFEHVKKIADYFQISEDDNPASYHLIGGFVNFLIGKNRLEHFSRQFEAYRYFMSVSKKQMHPVRLFIGKPEKGYIDGIWCEENWLAKKDDYFQKNSTRIFNSPN